MIIISKYSLNNKHTFFGLTPQFYSVFLLTVNFYTSSLVSFFEFLNFPEKFFMVKIETGKTG